MQLPLHLTISEALREKITSGALKPGAQLPSEHQLMSLYDVSRITVRRAIANLVNQGLVVSQRGKGVFVKEQRKVAYSLSSPLIFYEEDMARQGVTSSIHNLVYVPIAAPPEIRTILQLTEGADQVYLQKKLLLLDNTPVGVDITYIVAELGHTYAEELQRRMTFPTLEQNGIAIERVEALLECTRASHDMSAYLDVPLGDPLLMYCYTAYTYPNQPIVYGETLSRGDRLSYSVVVKK